MATSKKATATATAKSAPKGKDIFADIKDTRKESTAELCWGLMVSESEYAGKSVEFGVIIAKRIAAGERNVDIAKELSAIATANGNRLSARTAAVRVTRYERVGLAVLKAGKKDDLSDVVAKANAANRGTGARKAQPEGKSAKSNTEKASAMLDSLLKLVAKMDKSELEQFDTAISSVVVDAIAGRYTELETIEKVAV